MNREAALAFALQAAQIKAVGIGAELAERENGEEKGLPLLKEGGLRGKKWRKAGIRPRFSGTEAPLLLSAAGGDDIGSARCQ